MLARAALLAVLAGWPAAPAAGAEGGAREPKPFPVSKTAILREEKTVYIVDGRMKIPRGVSISCQKDVHIKAKGPGAVLEVEGTLEFQGVSAREVILEGVTIEASEKFQEVNLDSCIFRSGGGVRTPSGRASDGKLFVELCWFQTGTTIDIAMAGGSVDLVSSNFLEPVSIRAVDPTGSTRNRVRLVVRGCDQAAPKVGFAGGLVVENVSDVVIQFSRMAGALTAIRDWDANFRFDANKVNSGTLEFSHREAGRLPRATVVKCDVYSDAIVAKAPDADGVKDALKLERCWFRGVTDPKALARTIVKDGSADPAAKNGARIEFGKINDRPLELAGVVDR